MAAPRFSIGIDLGTTNSAMAFVPLSAGAATEMFIVPQWDTAVTLARHTTLPSFLYLPEDGGGPRDAATQEISAGGHGGFRRLSPWGRGTER